MSDKVRYGFDVSAAIPKDIQPADLIVNGVEYLPVVRCKDCKHHEELLNNNDENVLCWVHDIDVIVDGNGYCSYGERKEK